MTTKEKYENATKAAEFILNNPDLIKRDVYKRFYTSEYLTNKMIDNIKFNNETGQEINELIAVLESAKD